MSISVASMATFPFPPVNASLNGASAVLLVAALIFIKMRMVRAHTTLILCAVFTSTTFLAFYLTFHFYRASHGIPLTKYPAGSGLKPVYLAILGTHTVLAVATVPLVVVTLWRAYQRRWKAHKKIAWVTFPIWLYVSLTGVIIYVMLYHWPGSAPFARKYSDTR